MDVVFGKGWKERRSEMRGCVCQVKNEDGERIRGFEGNWQEVHTHLIRQMQNGGIMCMDTPYDKDTSQYAKWKYQIYLTRRHLERQHSADCDRAGRRQLSHAEVLQTEREAEDEQGPLYRVY